MPCRMKDVADRVGVSVTTVSHVLNKTRPVARETRRRVLEVIRELGFHRNAHARRLARGHSDFYGLIVSDIKNPFFPEIITSFESAALERGFDLLLCNTNYDPARTQAAVRKMIENKVRGVAVMTSELPGNLGAELAAHQVAVVFLDMGSVEPYISNIRVDYARGIRQAIDYLFELGHRDFAFIAGPQSLCSAVVRREAFLAALRRRGIPDYRVIEGNHKVDGAVTAVRALLAEPKLATAILCSNDLTAIGALSTLQQAGFQVPRDVSVVGFDDIDFASLAYPPLTTVSLPRDRLAKLAFEALQKILRSKQRLGAEYVVETSLVVRQTTTQARPAGQEGPPGELLSAYGR
jgi:DNA-binding LacI/PurR family transcriptional regulator